MLLVGLLWVSADAHGQDLVARYEGELIDDQARPLAGIFALTFKLYPEQEAEEAVWEEHHFLAVVEGGYTVRLGENTLLNPEWSGREMYVAVEFMGQEIVREAQSLTHSPIVEITPQDPLEQLHQLLAGRVIEVTFAHLADHALTALQAEHAADADRLGGRTAAEIDRYDDLVEMLAEHQIDPNAHGGAARTTRTTGDATMVLQRAGGEGGIPYTRMCPRGYVVVGIQGAAGGFIDSIQLVCAPLE